MFRKHPSLSKTHNCENVELLYLKVVTRFSPSRSPFSFSVGPVDPSVQNPGNNTEGVKPSAAYLYPNLP